MKRRLPPYPLKAEPDLDRVPLRGQLAVTLRLVQPGSSFVCHGQLRSAVYRLATALGLTVTVTRCGDGRLKVVRVL